MVLTTNHISLGLTWKLGLKSHSIDSATAQQYWQAIETWLNQNDHLDQLVSVMSVALVATDLTVILNHHGHPPKSYMKALVNWRNIVHFIQQTKVNVAETITRQAAVFVITHWGQTTTNDLEEIIFSQLRKKLYLWNEPQAPDSLYKRHFDTWLQEHPAQLNGLIATLGQSLIEEELKLLLSHSLDSKKTMQAKQFWENLVRYLSTQTDSQILHHLIQEAALFIEKQTAWHKLVLPMETLTPVTTIIPVPDQNVTVAPDPGEAKPKPTPSLWRWQPVPAGRDNYAESVCQNLTLPHGFRLLAARVRGKKHKHEGSHCDDWFEIAQSGRWGIIAVADGAGSKLFARVGARAACEAAVHYLVDQLHSHQLAARDYWTADTFARDDAYRFKENDIQMTQQFLHEALRVAYQAVEDARLARDELKYYYKALGNRDLELSDLATTLLLAVHTVVTVNEIDYSLVLSCQIGDGVTAAIYKNKAEASLLSEIERNNFSGETQFLTASTPPLDSNWLAMKTYPFFSPLRALMVMTDGVADDYFPPEKEILRLLGDLILNGIVPVSATLSTTLVNPSPAELPASTGYMTIEERLMAAGPQLTPICSVANYAKLLNSSPAQLMTTPAWLVAGIPREILDNTDTPAERLQIWLDTYNVRGSFDDRTLVVLYHETT